MSVPFNTLKCNACDYSSWLLSRNGWKYYLLPNDEKLTIESIWGWCYVCKDLKAIERLPASHLINEELRKAEVASTDVQNTTLSVKLLRLLGKDSFKIKQSYDRERT
jgi:hypothetical protein